MKFGIAFTIILATMLTIPPFNSASAQDKNRMIRIARLVIDSLQLQPYMAALKEHAETAVREEPDVIMLYAVAEKNLPTHITVFEIYADEEAYKKHLQAPHFLKYKTTTKNMVKSLDLVETVPIALESKMK